MNKIDKITDAQWQAIGELRERVIENQTAQYAADEIRSAFCAVAKLAGQDNLPVLIADGPLQAAYFAALLAQLGAQLSDQLSAQLWNQLSAQLGAQLRHQLSAQLGDQLWNQLRHQLSAQLGNQLWDQLRYQLKDQLWNQLKDQLWNQLGAQLRHQLGDQLWDQLWDQLDTQNGDQLKKARLYHWHTCYASWLTGGQIAGAKLDEGKMRVYSDWCDKCPMVLYASLPIVVRNPTKIVWNDRRQLHNDAGPSVLYRDGFAVWSVNGVRVDEQIVLRPATQTIEQIEADKDEEIKRIRIERYGWERYLDEVGAKVIHRRRNDIEGTREALFTTGTGMKILVCVCPSTAKVFSLEVEPTCTTCAEAQAFLSSGLSSRVISAS